jgi:hypothetical protein
MLVEYAYSFALQISVHSQDSKLRGAVSYVAPGDGGHVARGDGEFFLKKCLVAVVVLQSPPLLGQAVAHDKGSGEVG